MRLNVGWSALATRLVALSGAVVLSLSVHAGPSEGQGIYDSFCVVCHGGLGEGEIMGKPLVDNPARGLSDAELISVISNGRSGTGMAGYGGALSETEVRDVAGYIRVLQGGTGLAKESESSGLNTDPQLIAGQVLFAGKAACADCHSYRGAGGTIGPALDNVSARLNPAQLREALESPSRTIVSDYGVKVLKTTDGEIIRGRYRNESEQTIQILSADGKRWITQFKRNLKSVEDSQESIMPGVFASLGAAEQDALLVFLQSL